MPARRLEITVSEGTWERLEAARGHEPRASFVKRALDSALGHWEGMASVGADVTPREFRAPVEKEPSETKSAVSTEQADPAPVGSAGSSSEPVRSAAPSRPAKPSLRDTWSR